ncbi:hypothetical protein QTG54_012257 [Skeletonema marinoi]|uniref:Uncharacterized protein n=1 Tax=Skeletonema marinoi TaxID=267567 RepID=A0AAD9D7H3_9STRA|nr:hypothetical protein QTG54_012257 [Skeletonema marinoi]
MARFSIALALFPAATLAFTSTTTTLRTTTVLSAKNAQDPSRSAPSWTQARPALATYDDDFDAPVPANPQSGTTVLENQPVVDDECYMGANGDFDDCVDFDPPKQANDWTNVMDTPRGQKARDLPGWAKKA